MYLKLARSTSKYPKVSRCTSKYQEVPQGTKKWCCAIRGGEADSRRADGGSSGKIFLLHCNDHIFLKNQRKTAKTSLTSINQSCVKVLTVWKSILNEKMQKIVHLITGVCMSAQTCKPWARNIKYQNIKKEYQKRKSEKKIRKYQNSRKENQGISE